MATKNLNLNTFSSEDYVSTDPFNANFQTLDKLGVDYVEERGASGDWWYRKWHRGRFECGIENKWFPTSQVERAEGNLFRTKMEYNFGKYPVKLLGRPYANITFNDAKGSTDFLHGFPVVYRTGSTTDAPIFRLWFLMKNPSVDTRPVQASFGIHVIGRWK